MFHEQCSLDHTSLPPPHSARSSLYPFCGSLHCDPHPGGQFGRFAEQSSFTLLSSRAMFLLERLPNVSPEKVLWEHLEITPYGSEHMYSFVAMVDPWSLYTLNREVGNREPHNNVPTKHVVSNMFAYH